MRFLWALALATFLIVPAAAAPHPSVDVATLYAHGTGSDEFLGFMDTLPDGGDDTAMGSGNALTGGTNTWEWMLEPSLERGLTLDPSGTIDVTAYVGGSQAVGSVTVTTQLLSGDVVVADGAAQSHTITPATAGSGLYGDVTWSLTPLVTDIPAFTNLVWTLTVSGDASAVFVGVGEDRGRSNIVLPIASVESASGPDLMVNLTGNSPEIVLGGDAPDNRTIQYNWTTRAANVTAALDASIHEGSIQYTVMAGNATLLDVGFNATGETNVTQEDLVDLMDHHINGTANLVIHVSMDGFVGTFALQFVPPAPAPAPTPTTVIEPDEEPVEESPGLALPLVILALLGAALRRP